MRQKNSKGNFSSRRGEKLKNTPPEGTKRVLKNICKKKKDHLGSMKGRGEEKNPRPAV